MAKERFLTVLVPIKDDDCVNKDAPYASKAALRTAVRPSMNNTNKIYKVSYTSGGHRNRNTTATSLTSTMQTTPLSLTGNFRILANRWNF